MTIQEMIARQQAIVDGARKEGRGLTREEQTEFDQIQGKIDAARNAGGQDGNQGGGEPPAEGNRGAGNPGGAEGEGGNDDAARQAAVQAERQRNSDIVALCRQVGMDPAEYIRGGQTMDQVRQAAVEFMIANNGPVGTRTDDGQGNEFRNAAVDALLLRAGVPVSNPAREADSLRGMSVRDLMIECMARSGEGSTTSLLRMGKNDLWDMAVRQFLSPTASFPAILDQAIQKSIVHQYQLVPTTYDLWTSKGSLPDFKPSKAHEYTIGGGQFDKVTEGGELKHSTLDTSMNPLRKLDTYGTQFTMTREAFINDDIGFLSEMPGQYARVAKRKINKQVYEVIVKNHAVYDGVTLFEADAHKNLIATGTAPTIESVQKMMMKLLRQTDPFGESIMVQPKYILVPVGYGFLMSQLLETAQVDVEGIGSHTANALYKYRTQLQVVEEGAINALAGSSAVPWYIVGDKTTAKSVQVDYLNGMETPSFRRSEKAGYLGFVWDIWLDWGITVMDYRGIVRNNGVAIAE